MNPDAQLTNTIDEQEAKSTQEPGMMGENFSDSRLVKVFSGEVRMGFVPQVFG